MARIRSSNYTPDPGGGSGRYRGTPNPQSDWISSGSWGVNRNAGWSPTAAQAQASRRQYPWATQPGLALPDPMGTRQQDALNSNILGGTTNRTGTARPLGSVSSGGGGGSSRASGGGTPRRGASSGGGSRSGGGGYTYPGTAIATANKALPKPWDVLKSNASGAAGSVEQKAPAVKPLANVQPAVKSTGTIRPIEGGVTEKAPAKSQVITSNSEMQVYRPAATVAATPAATGNTDPIQARNLAAYKAALGPVSNYTTGRGFR